MGDGAAQTLLAELSETNPGSFARALYDRQKATEGSPATHSSVLGVLSEKIRCLGFDTALAMYDHPRQVDIARMGHEPVALFVTGAHARGGQVPGRHAPLPRQVPAR